jgi:hypothetical protein
MDFFSILPLRALLTYLVRGDVVPVVLEADIKFFRCAVRRGNRVRRRCRRRLTEQVVVATACAQTSRHTRKNNRRFKPWPT